MLMAIFLNSLTLQYFLDISHGEVPQRPNGTDSKSAGAIAHEGSNPSLSAIILNTTRRVVFRIIGREVFEPEEINKSGFGKLAGMNNVVEQKWQYVNNAIW